MKPATEKRWRRSCVIVVLAGLAPCALSQEHDAEQLREIKKLYEQVVGDGRSTISVEEGRRALEQLESWDLQPAMVDARHRRLALLCYVYASLATGDAEASRSRLESLQAEYPDDREALVAACCVACTVGDGKLGITALRKLSAAAQDAEKSRLRALTRRFKLVGSRAPNISVTTARRSEVSFAAREGKALVVFFWNLRKSLSGKQVQAMRRLYSAYRKSENVEFLGVSANSERDKGKAMSFVRAKGLGWQHHYETKSAGAPITHRAFRAGSQPMQIVIDGDGVIRGVGDIGDPALVYALRATVAEAEGRAEPPESRSAGGKATSRDPLPPAGEKKGDAKQPKELRNDMEAEAKVRQARLFLRTGLRTKAKQIMRGVVAKYPGTIQAKYCREMLESMP